MKITVLIALFVFSMTVRAAKLPWCAQKYDEIRGFIAKYVPRNDEGEFSLTIFLEPHVKRAFDQTLSEWQKRQLAPPIERTGMTPEQDWFEVGWKKDILKIYQNARSIGSATSSVALEVVKEGPTNTVHTIVENGTKKYFYSLEKGTALNRRHVASILSRELGIGTVPAAEFVYLNGKFGMLSEHAPGKGFVRGNNGDKMLELLAQGKVTESSYADAQAYQFLINNTDAHGEGVRVDGKGAVRVIDHDLAFGVSILSADIDSRESRALGWTLPKRYTKQFVAGLKKMDAVRIHALCDGHLSQAQINAVLFRRELILRDIANRGNTCIIP